jgi:tRNA dimethylallyltransferase
MPADLRPPLVVIVGPTAVGKTEISIQLAERLAGEIVSADSRLFYRGMDIGTAKPDLSQRARVPHHLVDVADPDQAWSLAVFQRAAYQAIAEIHARGRLPFLVGGTGQYVRAVTEGWQIPKVRSSPPLREALEDWAAEIGPNGLHDRLAALDPKAAARIDYRNLRRTVRALEVILRTGQQFSAQRSKDIPPFRSLQVGLTRPRKELYARVDARIDAMLSNGFVDEVRELLSQGYSPDLPTLSAIGYREIVAHLEGKTSFPEAVKLIKRHTRQFVRRQANWFKEDDPSIHWFRVEPRTVGEIEQLIRSWLAKGS